MTLFLIWFQSKWSRTLDLDKTSFRIHANRSTVVRCKRGLSCEHGAAERRVYNFSFPLLSGADLHVKLIETKFRLCVEVLCENDQVCAPRISLDMRPVPRVSVYTFLYWLL